MEVTDSQMYIFQDGIRYTIYCNDEVCDWDAFTAADAAPTNGAVHLRKRHTDRIPKWARRVSNGGSCHLQMRWECAHHRTQRTLWQ